ncbi:hypothetical protein [Mycolicibacterium tokaiense]|uniref:Uncharacterized protein n=1 Tax=Mycolicibacterium tokaiense TaxID=39695 RepID=A0A378T9X0_9MYCO|nr:hypothetical protein [Mycolicibacterium tokaiense]BBY87849.1 hypothetical protein MTOK_36310 [Mycolicibacterium tokaiense]STZ57632.1 Uncharacterised protein [Mycolicibacterium tokaiense]
MGDKDGKGERRRSSDRSRWPETAAAIAAILALGVSLYSIVQSRDANEIARDALAEAQRSNDLTVLEQKASGAMPTVDDTVTVRGECDEGTDSLDIDVVFRNSGRVPTTGRDIALLLDYEYKGVSGQGLGTKTSHPGTVLAKGPSVEIPGQDAASLTLGVRCEDVSFLWAGLSAQPAAEALAEVVAGKDATAGGATSLWEIRGQLFVQVDFGVSGPVKQRITHASID